MFQFDEVGSTLIVAMSEHCCDASLALELAGVISTINMLITINISYCAKVNLGAIHNFGCLQKLCYFLEPSPSHLFYSKDLEKIEVLCR
jgi:hypothetical protein